MTNNKENKETLYSSLLEQMNGGLDDYAENFPEIMRLCKLGLVKRGMTIDGKERFSVTDSGVEQLRFMSTQDTLEEAMDGIYQFML